MRGTGLWGLLQCGPHCSAEAQTLQDVPTHSQGRSRAVTPSRGSAGVRSQQTGGHCPSPLGPDPAAANPSGAWIVLDQPSHVRVGGDVYPLVTRGDPAPTLGALSSVPTVTPEHLQPTGLGGAWEDKAAFGCPRPGGQNASPPQPAGCRPLSVTHLVFVMT